MSLELVLLVPVLALLTVFVLWAGRGGQAALTADLAAEEAATAAALCCDEGIGSEAGRDALVEDMLASRPGLQFLCVGGLRPEAPPDVGSEPDFVGEHWLDFNDVPGARTGGVGVLGVQFSCESDGAVAPLRGLFPTVTFHGQATEVVVRQPLRPSVGFARPTFQATEGPSTQLVFTVNSVSRVPQDVTVGYQIDPSSTATAGSDYTAPTPPLEVTIPANQTSATITVDLLDDTLHEGTETLVLTLDPSSVTPAGVAQVDVARVSATGEILDDEPVPHLFVHALSSPCEVAEGGSLDFEVRLRDQSNTGFAPSFGTVTVEVDTAGTTPVQATAGTDYTIVDTSVSFSPGVDRLPVSVQTLDDTAGESNEMFRLVLSTPRGAPLGSVAEVTCTILDDEARVSVADVSASEGSPVVFKVTVDRSPGADIDLEYELQDPNPSIVPSARAAQRATPPGCAAGDDYLGLAISPGTLTVPLGQNPLQAVDLVVTTCSDSVAEPEERFWLSVSVSSGEGVMEPDGGAMGIIIDDDAPAVSVADVTASEGDTLEFRVSLMLGGALASLQAPVTLDYAVEQAVPVSAEAGLDYEAATTHPLTGTLVFGPGPATEQPLPVQLLADLVPNEGDETFVLKLSDGDPGDGVALAAASATGTITDVDPPELSVSDFTGPEGSTRQFTVSLANARPGETAEVDYVIGGGTATRPAAGVTDYDYTGVVAGPLRGTLTFPPGTVARNVGVNLRRDTIVELPETLRLTLSNPIRAVLFDRNPSTSIVDAYGEGTITDVGPPELTVNHVSVPEGDPMTFTVTLANPIAGQDVRVDYSVASRSARECRVPPASPPPDSGRDCTPPIGDYLPVAPGTLMLDDMSPTATVVVQTLTDRVSENPETLHLVLSGQTPAHIGLGRAVGVGTITNVNPATVGVTNPRVAEGGTLDFVVSLVDDQDRPASIRENVTVIWVTADRTAAAGADYNLRWGLHTFTPGGATTRTVSVTTLTDTVDEDDETMALVLSVVTANDAAVLGDAEGTGTIVDADPPRLFIGDADAHEGDALTFPVLLGFRTGSTVVETPTSATVRVYASTEDGTATAGQDYTERSSVPVEFAPGETSKSIAVQTTADDELEPLETMAVVLSSPSNATIDAAVGLGSIRPVCVTVSESARPPRMIVTDVSIREGTYGHPRLQFSQSLCDDSGADLGFEHRLVLGTADCDDIDSAACQPGTINDRGLRWYHTIAGHPLTGWALTASADGIDEPDETWFVEYRWRQSMPTPFRNEPWVRGTVTVIDADDEPHLAVGEANAPEGDPMSFPVSLNTPSGRAVSFEYRTVAGTATAGEDYVEADWTLVTIPAGAASVNVTVDTIGPDREDEGNETFRVEIRRPDASIATNPPANASIADAIAVGTITEGDGLTMTVADAQGDEGQSLSFEVALSEPPQQPVTVEYATVQQSQRVGTATAGDDYTPPPEGAELRFEVNEQFKTVDVWIEDDGLDETDETFLLELSNSQGASLVDTSAVGTIRGNIKCFGPDALGLPGPADVIQPAVLSSPKVREDAGRMSFVVTFDRPYCRAHSWTANLMTQSTATQGSDHGLDTASYYNTSALQSGLTIPVDLVDDDLDEADEETIILRVTNQSLGSYGHANYGDLGYLWELVGTIVDDDSALLAVAGASADEGDPLSFVVRLDRPATGAVTVDWTTADDTAVAPTDYRARSGTARIPAGRLSATAIVPTVEDRLHEADETLRLELSNPAIGGGGPAPGFAPTGNVGLGTIVNDDDPPAASVSDPTADEGQPLEFDVTLDTASGREVTIVALTRNGTATAGTDYRWKREPLVFAPGETAKTMSVETLGDSAVEGAERLFLDLSGTGVRFDDRTGTGTIRDVTPRRLRVSNASVVEGGALRFAVGFAGPAIGRDITVRYETSAGTATAGVDYASSSGVLTIAAGATSASVAVPTVQDTLDEAVERLRLVLSDPSGAALAVSEATGAIIDDDPEPALSVDDPEAVENGDGTPITFTLSLSEVSGRDVAVRYRTLDGTAKAGDDYVALSGGTAEILAGSASATVPVTLVDDDDAEEVERFRLVLSDPSNVDINDTDGVGTILDDDGLVQILVENPAAAYEAAGASVSFTVRLSRAAEAAVTVAYATEDATAAAGDDYTPVSSTLTFGVGETAKTVTVALIDDDEIESTETFRLGLSSPSANAEVGIARAVATILDDDDLPELSVAGAAATEGSAAIFAVTLSRPSARAVSVDYAAVVDALAGDSAAVPGLDFAAVSGTVTIPARSTSTTVRVALPDDALDEFEETFWLRLSNPSDGAEIDVGTSTGTIADNDPAPELSIDDASATEGQQIRFEVVLDAASGRAVTVPWATGVSVTGDPATPDLDFLAGSGTLTFPSGTTVARMSVTTVQDEVSEADETFQLQLGTPTHAAVDDGLAVGAIVDDDDLPRISVAGARLAEDESPAIFAVTLSRTSSRPVTAAYSIVDGTATRPDDYDYFEEARTLVIPAGLDTGQISVYIVDDDVDEDAENFEVTLSNPVNAVIAEGAGTATGLILDGDDAPRASIAGARASEDDGTIAFAVTLSHASDDAVTVRYSTFDGTATQPDDYVAASATLTIPAGGAAASAEVALTDDNFVEPAEQFRVRLSEADGAELGAASAIGVIFDDDTLPLLTLEGPTGVSESAGSVVLEAVLSHATDQEVRVGYRFYGWYPSACPRAVESGSGTVVFPPGATSRTFAVTIVDNDVVCATNTARTPSPGQRYRRGGFVALLDRLVDDVTGLHEVVLDRHRSPSIEVFVWDDEQAPWLDAGPRLYWDGVAETAGTAVFTVTQSYAHDQEVEVTYRTTNPIYYPESPFDRAATAGADYESVSSATVTIPAGETEATVGVTILDDDVAESPEGLRLELTRATNADLLGGSEAWTRSAMTWIDDDETPPELSVAVVGAAEGDEALFRVTMSRASDQDVTVAYATADGTAASPVDYVAASGNLIIKADDTEALIAVTVVDDSVIDPGETFTLSLSGPAGATIAADASSATATIADNDGLPVIDIQDGSGLESNQDVTFGLTLSEPSEAEVKVSYSIVTVPSLGDEAATLSPGTGRNDFSLSLPLEVTFPAGQTEADLYVGIDFEDNVPERDERFLVVLHDPENAGLRKARAWGTIIDDDLPIVSLADATVSEDGGYAEFVLELHEPALDPASLRYETLARASADAPARPGVDYRHTEGVLGLPAGATTATIRVPIRNDLADEEDETFLLELSEPFALELGVAAAVGTITDDDPGWTINDRGVAEDAGSMVFTVRRDHTSTSSVTLDYAVTGVLADGGDSCDTAGVDFVTPSGSLTLAPTATEAQISVVICDDTGVEGAETLQVELKNVPGRKLIGTGTITDND